MINIFAERLNTELTRNNRKLDCQAPNISLKIEGIVSGEGTVIDILN